jgi:cobaltochelatase CobS
MSDLAQIRPTQRVSVRELFGIDSDLMVPAFAERDAHVPEIDPVYRFNPDVTLAILAGFSRNRRVMLQGLHGTGKSTHVEQVAARLNWPCVRVNLDGHISRLDLVGKDAIVLRTACRSPSSRKASCPGRCSGRWRCCSTNTMPAART